MNGRVIVVRPIRKAGMFRLKQQHYPAFEVILSGDFRDVLKDDREVKLQIREVDKARNANIHDGNPSVIGEVRGKLRQLEGLYGHYYLDVSGTPAVKGALSPLGADRQARETAGAGRPQVGFAFRRDEKDAAGLISFALPAGRMAHVQNGKPRRGEGDIWELEVYAPEFDLSSPAFPVAWQRFVVPSRFHDVTQASYDWHAGNSVRFFTDASENSDGTAGAFHEIAQAIEKAEKFIFIVDWSFQPTARLDPKDNSLGGTIGAKLIAKARKDVVVAILTWTHPPVGSPDPVNNGAIELMRKMAGGTLPKTLHFRTMSRTSIFWTHHQKFIVTDREAGHCHCGAPPAKVKHSLRRIHAFYGGLDLTRGRFDSSQHGIRPNDNEVASLLRPIVTAKVEPPAEEKQWHPDEPYTDWYNAEFDGTKNMAIRWVRQPWHDIHAHLDGPVAWDFAREFVMRWSNLNFVNSQTDSVELWDFFKDTLMDRSQFVQQWERPRKQSEDSAIWTGQLLHSFDFQHAPMPRTNSRWNPKRVEFRWKVRAAGGGGTLFERSIQDSYLRAIAKAERFIHIENQYLIGSGGLWPAPRAAVKNAIPEALVNRILAKKEQNEPFHVYLVIPHFPEGKPLDGSMLGVRNLEWRTMAWMIHRLRSRGVEDWTEYLSFYFQARSDGAEHLELPKYREDNEDWDTFKKTQRIHLSLLNRRYMIYVHSKLMIVDDRFVILGSANINERSMAGDRDSEICVALWPSTNRVSSSCETAVIEQLRKPLLSEYFSGAGPDPKGAPESEVYREAFHLEAQKNYMRIRLGLKCNGHLAMFPFDVSGDGKSLLTAAWVPVGPAGKSKLEKLGLLELAERGALSDGSRQRHRTLLDSLWTSESRPDPVDKDEADLWSFAPDIPLSYQKYNPIGPLVE